jgi:hypothetical protein
MRTLHVAHDPRDVLAPEAERGDDAQRALHVALVARDADRQRLHALQDADGFLIQPLPFVGQRDPFRLPHREPRIQARFHPLQANRDRGRREIEQARGSGQRSRRAARADEPQVVELEHFMSLNAGDVGH